MQRIITLLNTIMFWVKSTAKNAAPSDLYTSGIVTGQKTITATPALGFAGGSELPERRRMLVRNEETDIRIRYGTTSSNLQENGFPIEPGETKVFKFDPAITQSIYLVSEGGQVTVSIEEK